MAKTLLRQVFVNGRRWSSLRLLELVGGDWRNDQLEGPALEACGRGELGCPVAAGKQDLRRVSVASLSSRSRPP